MSHQSYLNVFPSIRFNFLLLSFMMVWMSFAISWSQGMTFNPIILLEVLLVAVLAHAWVNLKNEIEDTESGLDAMTVKTPFSGGTGALQNPVLLQKSKRLMYLMIGLLVVTGVHLLSQISLDTSQWMKLFILLVVGLMSIWFYTSYCSRHIVLSLFVSGLCFGPIMMGASSIAFYPDVFYEVLMWSALPFLWVNNLLLMNQIPDQQADRKVGRKNYVIAFGSRNTVRLVALQWLLSILILASLAVNAKLTVVSVFIMMMVLLILVAKFVQSVLKFLEEDVFSPNQILVHIGLQKAQQLTVVINLLMPLIIGSVFIIETL
jgi:1,4-dihydroxy-2-naphthoate octaprenyltransferase